MNFMQSINDNLLILIPAMYILGNILKGIKEIKDKYIPLILLPIGVLLALAIDGTNVNSIIQGILITGTTVYTNQVVKQCNKKEK